MRKHLLHLIILTRIVSMRQEAGSIMEQIQPGDMVKHSALDMQEG